eukprot:scaffold20.g7789.t1
MTSSSPSRVIVEAVLDARVTPVAAEVLRETFARAISVRQASAAHLSVLQSQFLRNDAKERCECRKLALAEALPGVVTVSTNLLQPGPLSFEAVSAASALCGSVISSGRPALLDVGSSQAALSDMTSIRAEEGSSLFWCVPLVAGPHAPPGARVDAGAIGSLLLGYAGVSDVTQRELKAALLEAQRMAEQGGAALAAFLRRLSSLSPAAHSAWGPFAGAASPPSSACDPLSDSEAGSDWEGWEGGGGGGGAAATAWAAAPPAFVPGLDQRRLALWRGMSQWSLEFADEQAEAAYRGWRSSSLARVDAGALLALLAYHSSAYLLAPGLRRGNPLAAAAALPSAAVLAPLLLLLLGRRTRAWYARNRDPLLLQLYAVLCVWHCAGAAAYLRGGPGGGSRSAVGWAEAAWVVLLGGVLQAGDARARFVWHACAALAPSALLLGARWADAQALLAGGGQLRGMASWTTPRLPAPGPLSALLQSCTLHLLLAAGLVYCLERGSRCTFLRLPCALPRAHGD